MIGNIIELSLIGLLCDLVRTRAKLEENSQKLAHYRTVVENTRRDVDCASIHIFNFRQEHLTIWIGLNDRDTEAGKCSITIYRIIRKHRSSKT